MAPMSITDTQRALIFDDYFARWDQDDLSDAIVINSPAEQPLRNVRGFVMAMWEVEQNWCEVPGLGGPSRSAPLDLERSVFRDFLARRVWLSGRELPVGTVALHALCIPTVRNSVWDVLSADLDPPETAVLRDRLDSLVADLSLTLWDATVERYGDRRLISWFIVERDGFGWLRYFEHSFSSNDEGRHWVEKKDQRRKAISTSAGDVDLRWNRLWTESEDVNAFEWEARLRSNLGVVQAVANGSLYTRKRGIPRIDVDELFYTAEECSDHDAAMVHELGKEGGALGFGDPLGDLLLVWNWERLPHADPGVGELCLDAALRALKRSYKGIRGVVVDARPGQFASWGDFREHPQVAEQRAKAVSRVALLAGSVVGTALPGMDLFLVYPTIDEHPCGVFREVGRRGVQRLASEP